MSCFMPSCSGQARKVLWRGEPVCIMALIVLESKAWCVLCWNTRCFTDVRTSITQVSHVPSFFGCFFFILLLDFLQVVYAARTIPTVNHHMRFDLPILTSATGAIPPCRAAQQTVDSIHWRCWNLGINSNIVAHDFWSQDLDHRTGHLCRSPWGQQESEWNGLLLRCGQILAICFLDCIGETCAIWEPIRMLRNCRHNKGSEEHAARKGSKHSDKVSPAIASMSCLSLMFQAQMLEPQTVAVCYAIKKCRRQRQLFTEGWDTLEV